MNSYHTSVQEAFDRHAKAYDEQFSGHVLGESIRSEVWDIADSVFAQSRKVLDLGCGTGEDAIHFACKGIHVTAVDISPRMIAQLKAKALQSGVSTSIDPVVSPMEEFFPKRNFDGVFSNFGALNCVPNLTWLRKLARRALNPGASLVLTSMGRFYPLETAILLYKGNLTGAFRRFRRPCEVSVEGVRLAVHYHSLRSLKSMLGDEFHLREARGLRAFLPVPSWDHLGNPPIWGWAASIDKLWCRLRITAEHADHFVSVWSYQREA